VAGEAEAGLRLAGRADVPALLAVYDARVAWLVAQGRQRQWGDRPFSVSPGWIARVESHVDNGWLWLAVDGDDRPLGAMALTNGPPFYVDPVDEPEIYVKGFVTAPGPAARHVGALLWRNAERVAAGTGVALLRLDCYADGDRKLVDYYRGRGFQPVRELEVFFHPADSEPYHGCLLQRRLDG
jgi:hypothetical protein